TEAPRRATFGREFVHNAGFLIRWLALAYMLEAILVTYVPASVIAGVVGGEGVLPIAVAAVVGMPAYLNSYVAPALLSGLMEQGMSAGAAMSFMIAGAVSSIPAMAAVWSLVKRPVFAAYLGLGVSGAIISGVIFQAVI
ncbi:MAG: permease, partial [Pseudomonadota bacterium]